MAVLSAALAFAITMLILSMATTVMVETIHRFIGLRERGLHLMLGHLYDRVIAPYLVRQGLDEGELKKQFVDLMTVNRAPAGAAGLATNDEAKTKDLSNDDRKNEPWLLSKLWGGRRLSTLEGNAFMSRLGGSEFGAAIESAVDAAGLKDPAAVLNDIAVKFDQFGQEASEYFQRRARLMAVLVALVVAWFMHVHPLQLFDTYRTQPLVAEAVIKLQDEALKKYEDLNKDGQQTPPVNPEAAAKKAKEAWDALRKAVDDLTQKGAPLGWKDRFTEEGFATWKIPLPGTEVLAIPYPKSGAGIATAVWLILGGFLIGLGGPFWYDLVKSLSSIRSLLGGGKAEPDTAGSPKPPGGGTPKPQTAVENFTTAAQGRKAAAAALQTDDDGFIAG